MSINKSAKTRTYLFNEEFPKGQIHNVTPEQLEELLDNGWFSTPAKLKLTDEGKVDIDADKVEKADPMRLKEILEGIGFFVLTAEQIKAEANKMADGAFALTLENMSDLDLADELKHRIGVADFQLLELEEVTDEVLLAEAERRGLKEGASDTQSSTELDELLNKFNEEPKALNKDELVDLGNTKFQLGLRSNMKEDTLIGKITEALNAE